MKRLSCRIRPYTQVRQVPAGGRQTDLVGRRQKAELVIVLVLGTLGGIDGAIPQLVFGQTRGASNCRSFIPRNAQFTHARPGTQIETEKASVLARRDCPGACNLPNSAAGRRRRGI